MTLKNGFLFLFILIFITSSDLYHGILFSLRPLPVPKKVDLIEFAWIPSDDHKQFLEDQDDRVSDLFKISPYYYPTVNFWFLIYTQFSSTQVVVHDKTNMSLIYKILDFSALHEHALANNTIYSLQQKVSNKKVDELRNDFKVLTINPFAQDPRSRDIYSSIKNAGIRIPQGKNERILFFKNLQKNLRSQTGQKNFIRDGIIRSYPYQSFLIKYFESKNLPVELLSIPFLESSFNPKAKSRVGASGVWQFMPLIAFYFMPKRSSLLDYRSNVAVSSAAAAHLLSENFNILKSWDLAVTAYNSGTKHLLRSRHKLKLPNANLETIIKKSTSNNFGFASKNFYSEFLALAHVLAYKEDLFSDLHKSDHHNADEPLDVYLAKCSLKLNKALNRAQLDDVIYHNFHITDDANTFPRGLILTTKETLPKSKFLKLNFEQYVSKKPVHWNKFLSNQSCSTR